MYIYLKLNENTPIGTYWNFSGVSFLELYALLRCPKYVVTIRYKTEREPLVHRIEDEKDFFDIDFRVYPDFACIDCSPFFHQNELSETDRILMKGMLDGKRIDSAFPSVRNHFFWYTHDGGGYTAIAQDAANELFFQDILQMIYKHYGLKSSLQHFREMAAELFGCAKSGIYIDSSPLIYGQGKPCFVINEWIGGGSFTDMHCEREQLFQKRKLFLC